MEDEIDEILVKMKSQLTEKENTKVFNYGMKWVGIVFNVGLVIGLVAGIFIGYFVR